MSKYQKTPTVVRRLVVVGSSLVLLFLSASLGWFVFGIAFLGHGENQNRILELASAHLILDVCLMAALACVLLIIWALFRPLWTEKLYCYLSGKVKQACILMLLVWFVLWILTGEITRLLK